MSKYENFQKLDSLLRDPAGHTVNEIKYELADDPCEKTVKNYLKEIQEAPYNMVLADNLYRGRARLYRYLDIKKPCKFFNNEEELNRKIGEMLSFLNQSKGNPQYDWVRFSLMALRNSKLDDREIMGFEGNPDLEGMEFFEPVADAIIHKYPLKLVYKPFKSDGIHCHIFPYYLKQYNRRWFLLARSEDREDLSIFALDRIVSVEHLSKPFVDTDIDFTEYFDDVIGVSVHPKKAVEKILLRVSSSRYDSIKTKPMHSSQTELKDQKTRSQFNLTDGDVLLRIKVKPNKELRALLLSYGADVTVLSPQSLRDEMKEIAARMNEQYSK